MAFWNRNKPDVSSTGTIDDKVLSKEEIRLQQIQAKEDKILQKLKAQVEQKVAYCGARIHYPTKEDAPYCLSDGPGAYDNRRNCPCYSNEKHPHPNASSYILCSYPNYEVKLNGK